MVLGFSLVMRIQIAYQRFWEGTSQCHLAIAKWGDAAMQVFAFDEASKDAFDETGFEFRMLILHYTSLMTACALIDIRRDDDDLNAPMTVNYEDPYFFRPSVEKQLEKLDKADVRRMSMDADNQLDAVLAANVALPGMPGDMHGGSTARSKSRASARASTVPLQMLLQTRRNLQTKYQDLAINSYEAVESKDRGARPASFGETALDMRFRNAPEMVPTPKVEAVAEKPTTRRCSVLTSLRRGTPQGVSQGEMTRRRGTALGANNPNAGATSGEVDMQRTRTRTSEERLRRGSATEMEYLKAAVFMKASAATKQRLARANQFDVVGGVSQGEVDILGNVAPGDRAYVVQTWIVRLMTNRLAAGGLAIPPPLLSRTYQVLSDGTAAAMQARKVSYVAFPFPLRQLLVLLLGVFIVIAPICIASFMSSEPLVGVLSFFVCLGYTALNETAAEIENPFGLGANHHQLTVYMRQFNSKLARLFDLTLPDLGYRPPEPRLPTARGLPGIGEGATTLTTSAARDEKAAGDNGSHPEGGLVPQTLSAENPACATATLAA